MTDTELVEGIGCRDDVVGEQALDVNGVEMAASAAVLADDLDAALVRQRVAGFRLAQHLQDVFGLCRRTAAAKIDGARLVDANVILGKQLANQLQAGFVLEVRNGQGLDEKVKPLPVEVLMA